ncbi:MAG: hypothetical protein IPL42_03425 [Saprospiraceae bacterium]|nr:hypothetical protein [Saprospiraceae bacterium]
MNLKLTIIITYSLLCSNDALTQNEKDETLLAKTIYYITCSSYNGSLTNSFDVCKQLNSKYKYWNKLSLISPKVLTLYENAVMVWNQGDLQELCRQVTRTSDHQYIENKIYNIRFEVNFNSEHKFKLFLSEFLNFESNMQILNNFYKFLLNSESFTKNTIALENITTLINLQLEDLFILDNNKFLKKSLCKESYIKQCYTSVEILISKLIEINQGKIINAEKMNGGQELILIK